MSDRVFVIGAGRVGRGFSRAFRASGGTIVGLHARHANEETTSSGEYPPSMSDANVILIAVRDAEIDGVCRALADLQRTCPGRIAHGTVVLHTSGTVDPPAFIALRKLGIDAGTFHPLIPFATPERGAQLLHNAWVGIDGDANARAAARRLAAAVGARTVNIPTGQKSLYHAAAVMASNFPIVLAAIAGRLLTNAGVEAQTAAQVVYSLMHSAVGNLVHGSPREVLTGPATRGDTATIAEHLRALHDDPEAAAVYDLLIQAAQRIVR